MSKVSASTGASKVDSTDDGGNTWIQMSEDAHCSAIDDSTVDSTGASKVDSTAMAWFVMPVVLRKMHKYASEGTLRTLWRDSSKKHVSYETSLWSALEDPTKYIITFMAFSQM